MPQYELYSQVEDFTIIIKDFITIILLAYDRLKHV